MKNKQLLYLALKIGRVTALVPDLIDQRFSSEKGDVTFDRAQRPTGTRLFLNITCSLLRTDNVQGILVK